MRNIDYPAYLFHQGTNYRAYELLGCHIEDGCAVFRVWAPDAVAVNVTGDFNGWDDCASPMERVSGGGIWQAAVPEAKPGDKYKYHITGMTGRRVDKADPYAFYGQYNDGGASIIYDISTLPDPGPRFGGDTFKSPMNIYECSLGSWDKKNNGSEYLTYDELADSLIPYAKKMGYTHLELMPNCEYPFDGSWGYQVTGYFAPSSRFGDPAGFARFVRRCHDEGLGVIMDWVPAHFPKDEFGLVEFDGAPLYEYAGWDKIEHKTWGTRRFDLGRCEVQSFLISSALFFIGVYGLDGLRVDAVSSMIYLDYDKQDGEWLPNAFGGHENLEGLAFLRKLNDTVRGVYPDAIMVAEESSAWNGVTKPPSEGGLGFTYKWNMGWMNDILSYIENDPLFRGGDHSKLTFPLHYAFNERYILPISHDEVVHGKKSLLDKMPGTFEQKFAGLRGFMVYMYTQPGKKLIFMGSDIAQVIEWDEKRPLDWFLLKYPLHDSFNRFLKELNLMYKETPAFWQDDGGWGGFRWLEPDDRVNSVISYLRQDDSGKIYIVIINFSFNDYKAYTVPLEEEGVLFPRLCSEEYRWSGCGTVNGPIRSVKTDKRITATLAVPPASGQIFEFFPLHGIKNNNDESSKGAET